MGAWGNGLYQNDIALDVRELLEAALDDGRSPHDAIGDVVNSVFLDYDEWEKSVAWLALADTMLSRGYISEELRRTALDKIDWFAASGFEKNDMLGDALRDLRTRLENVPREADAEEGRTAELKDVEQDEVEPEAETAGPLKWLSRIKKSLSGKK